MTSLEAEDDDDRRRSTQLASRAAPREQATSAPVNRQYVPHPAHRGPTEVITVRIDHRFAPSDQAKIRRAIEQWNYVLNGHIRFNVNAVPFGIPAAVPAATTVSPAPAP